MSLTQPGMMAQMGCSFIAPPVIGKMLTFVREGGFGWWWCLGIPGGLGTAMEYFCNGMVASAVAHVLFVVCFWCEPSFRRCGGKWGWFESRFLRFLFFVQSMRRKKRERGYDGANFVWENLLQMGVSIVQQLEVSGGSATVMPVLVWQASSNLSGWYNHAWLW